MARAGTVFGNYYVECVCSPSRATFLTGTLPAPPTLVLHRPFPNLPASTPPNPHPSSSLLTAHTSAFTALHRPSHPERKACTLCTTA